jgi:hypothetical protein
VADPSVADVVAALDDGSAAAAAVLMAFMHRVDW